MERDKPYEHADYVRKLVDGFPPLNSEQRAKLSILLRPARKASLDMDAHVRAVVDQAPPPSPEQLARLRLILGNGGSDADRQVATDAAIRDLDNAPPSTGHIYVIEFSSGTIKVGRTVGRHRMTQHRVEAERHGVVVVNEWLSPAHASWFENESRLIAYCVERGGERKHVRSEYFTGLDFIQIKSFAEHLAAQF
jgi:hypothetical protein